MAGMSYDNDNICIIILLDPEQDQLAKLRFKLKTAYTTAQVS